MTAAVGAPANVPPFDAETRALVRLAAAVAGGDEPAIRRFVAEAVPVLRPVWADELILQSYLFAGFPRMLNAMREWRRASGVPAPAADAEADGAAQDWRARGEATCAAVYDGMYARLRENVRELHPAIDAWMIGEGYGRVLGRPGLDLPRRELCIVAACVAARQDRQLHSHLHGARNVGAPAAWVDATLEALTDVVGADQVQHARLLWRRVQGR